MGPTGCPETSVNNHQSTLRNIPEEQISHLHHGGSQTSRKCAFILYMYNTSPSGVPIILCSKCGTTDTEFHWAEDADKGFSLMRPVDMRLDIETLAIKVVFVHCYSTPIAVGT
jgi:hypothetical protein